MKATMTRTDRYLKYAERCRRSADRARKADRKAEWLMLAARYQRLAEIQAEIDTL